MEENIWKNKAREAISSKLESENFPCFFAKKAWKNMSYNIAFVDYNENGFYEFLEGLQKYTSFVKETNLKDRLIYPLIVIFKSSGKYHSSHSFAWDALQWVSSRDLLEWPEHININPDNPSWSFCFNNVELFINISSPLHKQLKSRNLGENLVLVINPRLNFDEVANGNTKEGLMIREKIRNRIRDYNQGHIPTELGYYGDTNNSEWKQYQLEEDGLPRPSKCPFSNFFNLKLKFKG